MNVTKNKNISLFMGYSLTVIREVKFHCLQGLTNTIYSYTFTHLHGILIYTPPKKLNTVKNPS